MQKVVAAAAQELPQNKAELKYVVGWGLLLGWWCMCDGHLCGGASEMAGGWVGGWVGVRELLSENTHRVFP